jgi:hypothetical protein
VEVHRQAIGRGASEDLGHGEQDAVERRIFAPVVLGVVYYAVEHGDHPGLAANVSRRARIADGVSRLYAHLIADAECWPWLLHAGLPAKLLAAVVLNIAAVNGGPE